MDSNANTPNLSTTTNLNTPSTNNLVGNNLPNKNPANNNKLMLFNNTLSLDQVNVENLSNFILPLHYLPKNISYTQKHEPDSSIPENETLYVKNLNDKINVKYIKKLLKELFGKYNLLKVILMKSYWRKGQAWLIFDSKENSKKALNDLNGFILFGHSLVINYSLESSYYFLKKSGDYVDNKDRSIKKPRNIRLKEQQLLSHYNLTNTTPPTNLTNLNNQMDPSYSSYTTFSNQPQQYLLTPLKPNKLLFIENLPSNINNNDLINIFNKINGFVESRLIPSKNVAFIEFDNEMNSSYALQCLQGHLVNGQPLIIAFAKH